MVGDTGSRSGIGAAGGSNQYDYVPGTGIGGIPTTVAQQGGGDGSVSIRFYPDYVYYGKSGLNDTIEQQ